MKVRKIIFLLVFGSVFARLLGAQDSHRTLTNADIVSMAKSGIGEQTIILTIQKSTGAFDTSPEALIQLKTAGVSDAVLNAMLISPPATPTAVLPTLQDCSQTLDKVLAFVGIPAKIASVQSSKLVGKSVINRASASNSFQLERVTVWMGSIHASLRPATGTASTIVITPEFNYLVSGKMTTAVPASTLQELESGLKLDLIYIAQHRNDYSCVLDGTEQIGNVRLLYPTSFVSGQRSPTATPRVRRDTAGRISTATAHH